MTTKHKKTMVDLLNALARKHSPHRVFSDFCEMSAIAFSNGVDRTQRESREARYLQIVAGYERAEVLRFSHLLGVLTVWLSEEPTDCLGELYMSLGLGNSQTGQFFTPYELSSLMARLTLDDKTLDTIAQRGFVTLSEPAVGSGGMVIAMSEAMKERGVNPQDALHVTATDIDATAVHMTYVQLSLLHIPAFVVHGNTLTLTEWGHWVTPAHVLGGWNRKLKDRRPNAPHSTDGVPAVSMASHNESEAGRPILRNVKGKAEQILLF